MGLFGIFEQPGPELCFSLLSSIWRNLGFKSLGLAGWGVGGGVEVGLQHESERDTCALA